MLFIHMLFSIFPIGEETLSRVNSIQTLSLAAYVNEYLNHPPLGKSYQYKSHIQLTTLEEHYRINSMSDFTEHYTPHSHTVTPA